MPMATVPVPSIMPPIQPPPMYISDSYSMISWFRSEFAAANAIIDALCGHLAQLGGDDGCDYSSLFSAIHRRRLHWIPILQMQKYESIAEVALELRRVEEKKADSKGIGEGERRIEDLEDRLEEEKKIEEKKAENDFNCEGNDRHEEYDWPNSEITDSGKYNYFISFSLFLERFCYIF